MRRRRFPPIRRISDRVANTLSGFDLESCVCWDDNSAQAGINPSGLFTAQKNADENSGSGLDSGTDSAYAEDGTTSLSIPAENYFPSYPWEDANKGILMLSTKAHNKEGWIDNPNKRKGSEDRQKSGDRERNVGHPNGEEHSRVPKGSGGSAKGSNGPLRSDTLEGLGRAVLGGIAAAGAGYLIYRGLRMLPSLLPPLWWTIPANLAMP